MHLLRPLVLSIPLLALTLASPPAAAAPSADPDHPGKWLVKLGWDGEGPQKLLDNLERARTLPFDGHVFKIDQRLQNAFWKEPLPREEFQEHFDAMEELARTDLGNAKHNLVMVLCTGEAGWDWFDDDHWAATLANLRVLTELAAAAGAESGFDTGGDSPDWRVTQRIEDGTWTVEAAIPWSAIGGRPRNDQDLRLNIARNVTNQHGVNFQSLSQTDAGFLDPTEFGTVLLNAR